MSEAPDVLRPPALLAAAARPYPAEPVREPVLDAAPPSASGTGDELADMLADAEAKAQRALRETTVSSVSATIDMGGVRFRLAWTRPRRWWQV